MYGISGSNPARSSLPHPNPGDGRLLLLERPAIPWPDADDGWTALERADYERARRGGRTVLRLDGSSGQPTSGAPAVLRESLLSLWGESPDDAELRRELARLPDAETPGDERRS